MHGGKAVINTQNIIDMSLKVTILGIFVFCLFLLNPADISAQRSVVVGNQTYVEDGGALFMDYRGKRYDVLPDVVTVKFRKGTGSAEMSSFYSANNIEVIRQNKLGYVDISVPAGKTPVQFISELQATGMFESAEANVIGEYLITPNDPLFNNQWGLHNTGQTGGTNDADIDAPEAWDIETGSPTVIVAVLDSGTDIDHVDLNCNIWVNPGEDLGGDGIVWDLTDLNGIDDDGNGKIDDIVGWDFGNNNNDPRGFINHGTHVSGIVAACTNNGQGVSGVAGGWGVSNGIKMMTLGVGDAFPNGSILDDAIIYAADMGARVITMSLGVGPSSAIDAALNYAYNVRGAFIDNASGNENGPVTYPADDPNVMAVGATDHNDNRASFSNHGPELEVVAPGVSIPSTGIGNVYGTGSGTSFASPHVAGVAALILSQNSGLTNAQVRQCITQSAEDQVGNPIEDIPGKDNFYGFGRLNARDALVACGGAVSEKSYDIWVTQSFAGPPFNPFHDCLRVNSTGTQVTIDGLGTSSGAVVETGQAGIWIAIFPVSGVDDYFFYGTFLSLGENDVISGSGIAIANGWTFGSGGQENANCFLSQNNAGSTYVPFNSP